MNSQRIQLTILLLVISLGAFAQQGWHVGVTGAYQASFILHQNNYQTLNGTAVSPKATLAYRYTSGYTAGIQGGYNFTNKYGIVSGVYYNKSGQHYEDTYIPGPEASQVHVTRKLDFTYVQIPVLFKYNFGPYKKRLQAFVMAGPQVGILTLPEEEVVINGDRRTDLTPATAKFKKVDLGVSAAIGVDYYFNPRFYMEANVQAYVSVMDINSKEVKNSNWYGNNNVEYQNSYNFQPGVSIGFHYLFNKIDMNPFKPKTGSPILPATSMR